MNILSFVLKKLDKLERQVKCLSAVVDDIQSSAYTTTEYNYNTNNTPPPGNQQIRLNNSDSTLVTEIYLSVINGFGVNISAGLSIIEVGNRIYIQKKTDSTLWAIYDITAISDNTTYFTFDVTYIDGSGVIPSGNTLVAILP